MLKTPPPSETHRVRLRVHFAPMGFEVQRVVVPAKVLRADVVVLFTLNRADNARRALELAIADLKTERILHHVVECNIWDPPAVVNEVGSIVTASPHHEYFFNVSTGAKTACIGGTIAGMFWRVQPYYQAVDYGSKPIAGKEDYPVKGPPVFVPTFETPMLDRGTVGTLEFIVNEKAPTSKKELMNHLKESSTIRPRTKPQVTAQALHAQTDVILRRLDSWGFLRIEGRGKRMLIQATEKGRGGARMFHHMLFPQPEPTVLKT
jgi:hypothetical protein